MGRILMTQNELNHLAVELIQAHDVREASKMIARAALTQGLGVHGALEAINFVVQHRKEQRA